MKEVYRVNKYKLSNGKRPTKAGDYAAIQRAMISNHGWISNISSGKNYSTPKRVSRKRNRSTSRIQAQQRG